MAGYLLKLLATQQIYESSTLYETKIVHRSGYSLWSIPLAGPEVSNLHVGEVNFRNLYGVCLYVVAESFWEDGETREILFIFVMHAAEGAIGTFVLMVVLMTTSNLHLWALGLEGNR